MGSRFNDDVATTRIGIAFPAADWGHHCLPVRSGRTGWHGGCRDRFGAARAGDVSERDGATTLVGYLFKPATAAGKAPGVVMMHGRGGVYAANARGKYTADTLSLRHKAWGRIWADAGYVALLVDSFGPRGYPKGFPRFSYADRPAAVSEVTVRPLDAYGALAWLRARPDVIPDRIGLHGWSNGGGTTLMAISNIAPGITSPTPSPAFAPRWRSMRTAGCAAASTSTPLKPYAPTLAFHGTADEETSLKRCARPRRAQPRRRRGDRDRALSRGDAWLRCAGCATAGGRRQHSGGQGCHGARAGVFWASLAALRQTVAHLTTASLARANDRLFFRLSRPSHRAPA